MKVPFEMVHFFGDMLIFVGRGVVFKKKRVQDSLDLLSEMVNVGFEQGKQI